jgi:hypothetical protein
MRRRWLILIAILLLASCSKPREPRVVPAEPGRIPSPPKK